MFRAWILLVADKILGPYLHMVPMFHRFQPRDCEIMSVSDAKDTEHVVLFESSKTLRLNSLM